MDWSKIIGILLENARNYFLTAGIAFTTFYIIFRKKISLRKIQPKFPKSRDYRREITYSIISIVIFSFPPVFILFNNTIRPLTQYYTDIAQHTKLYFFSAFVMMIFIHDTYFYWLHRLMHNRFVFKLVHLAHHKSTNPSPWAAYAFHPLEAVLESGIFVLLLFIMPLHDWHLIIFFVCSLIYNVYGHLGYEVYPKGFNKHWLGKWLNTSVNHNMHHQYFEGNYGLYFTFWDRLMGTIRPDYDQHYDKVKDQ
jgi:Delta7-sterol 5-desaturase